MNLFDIADLEKQLQDLEKKTMEENFWNDNKNSSKVLSQIKNIKSKTSEYKRLSEEITNLQELTELVELEPEEEKAKDIRVNYKKKSKNLKLPHFYLGNMTATMPLLPYIQEQEERNPKTGQRCYIECIRDGAIKTIMK